MRIHTIEINEGDPRLPVVIAVANVEDEITKECLRRLAESTNLPLRVILAESTGHEFSYGRSMNAGIEVVGDSEIIICMDSDAFPRPGCIEALTDRIGSDGRIGFAAAKVCSDRFPSRIGWVHSNILWFIFDSLRNGWFDYLVRRLIMGGWWSFSVRSPNDFVPNKMVGALTTMFALRRACYQEVGPFDERYRVSFVDVDYSYRILISRNWHITSCPNAVVFHMYHASQDVYGHDKSLEGWRLYLDNWPKDRIRLVLDAARKGKFLIPPDR